MRSISYVSRTAADVAVDFAGNAAYEPVGSLDEIVARLQTRAPSARPQTLDLIGHSRRGSKLLVIGTDTIDGLSQRVQAVFARLRHDGLLARHSVTAIRLLGCDTAGTAAARFTLRALSRISGVPVLGTRVRLSKHHHGALGFDARFETLLVTGRTQLEQETRMKRQEDTATQSVKAKVRYVAKAVAPALATTLLVVAASPKVPHVLGE